MYIKVFYEVIYEKYRLFKDLEYEYYVELSMTSYSRFGTFTFFTPYSRDGDDIFLAI